MPPWNTDDMRQKDSHIKTPKDARQARDVANQVLKETGDEGRALLAAAIPPGPERPGFSRRSR